MDGGRQAGRRGEGNWMMSVCSGKKPRTGRGGGKGIQIKPERWGNGSHTLRYGHLVEKIHM